MYKNPNGLPIDGHIFLIGKEYFYAIIDQEWYKLEATTFQKALKEVQLKEKQLKTITK